MLVWNEKVGFGLWLMLFLGLIEMEMWVDGSRDEEDWTVLYIPRPEGMDVYNIAHTWS